MRFVVEKSHKIVLDIGGSNMRDVIIIGSGPAGLTAAIYTARANLRPLVISGMERGGQVTLTNDL